VPKALSSRVLERLAPYQKGVYKSVYHHPSKSTHESILRDSTKAALKAKRVRKIPDDLYDRIFGEPVYASSIATAHTLESGHLPVDQQIDRIITKPKRIIRGPEPQPLVPRHKPLLPVLPIAKPDLSFIPLPQKRAPAPLITRVELSARITDHPLPLTSRIDIDFKKKSPIDVTAQFSSRIDATIKRLDAIFDKKNLFDLLPAQRRNDLHRIADQLDWLSEHVNRLHSWSNTSLRAVNWGLKSVGGISFKQLGTNYERITKEIADLHYQGYFEHVPFTVAQ
jgi:hypothetical protein